MLMVYYRTPFSIFCASDSVLFTLTWIFLFLRKCTIYINSLNDVIKQTNTNIAQFADDRCLWVTGKNITHIYNSSNGKSLKRYIQMGEQMGIQN